PISPDPSIHTILKNPSPFLYIPQLIPDKNPNTMNQKNPGPSRTSRRTFIKNSLIASSVFIVPRHVLGGVGFTAPSDQLVLAAIGAGGKGRSDIKNASVNGREKVIALCDVDFSGS